MSYYFGSRAPVVGTGVVEKGLESLRYYSILTVGDETFPFLYKDGQFLRKQEWRYTGDTDVR